MKDVMHPARAPSVPPVYRLRLVSAASEALPMPSPDELAGLIGLIARTRDRQAFAALFLHFGPRLKTFFLKGGLSAQVAEELAQETLLSVWTKAAYFDSSRAGAATWIFTVARNLRIDHLRRQRNPSALFPETEERPPTLEQDFLHAERDGRVRAAIGGLSSDQAEVIRLSFYGEKSQVEIAQTLDLPLGTVKSRVRLAMKRLRGLLEGEL